MSARLFAALDLPAPVRDALGAFGHAAAEDDFALRAVRDDALHVTLAFLGHRPLDDIEPACEAVRSVAAPVGSVWKGTTTGLTRDAVPPACQIQVIIFTPRASSSLVSSRPISAFFQAKPCS